jgi:hypothetical protein
MTTISRRNKKKAPTQHVMPSTRTGPYMRVTANVSHVLVFEELM